MFANPHQRTVISLEQCDIVFTRTRYALPDTGNFSRIDGVFERLLVNANRPLVEPLRPDLRVLLEARQQVSQRRPVFEFVIQPPEQRQCVRMVFRVFVDAPQRRQRLFVLTPIDLEFCLRQQYCVGGFRRFLEGQAQPFVTAIVMALQVRGARGLQVVEQR